MVGGKSLFSACTRKRIREYTHAPAHTPHFGSAHAHTHAHAALILVLAAGFLIGTQATPKLTEEEQQAFLGTFFGSEISLSTLSLLFPSPVASFFSSSFPFCFFLLLCSSETLPFILQWHNKTQLHPPTATLSQQITTTLITIMQLFLSRPICSIPQPCYNHNRMPLQW